MNGSWAIRYYSKQASRSLLTWEREFARCAVQGDCRGANLHWKSMVDGGLKPNRKIVTSFLKAHVKSRGSIDWHPDVVRENVDLQDHSGINALLVQAAETVQNKSSTAVGTMDACVESDARVLFEFVKERHDHDEAEIAAFFWSVATSLLKSRLADVRAQNLLLIQAIKERKTDMIEMIAARIHRGQSRAEDVFNHATKTLASLVLKGHEHALNNLQRLQGVDQNKVLSVMRSICQDHPTLGPQVKGPHPHLGYMCVCVL